MAIWKKWEARFGATFALVLATIQNLVLRLAEPAKVPGWVKSFPPGYWLYAGLLFFIWACYLVWKDQAESVERLTWPNERPIISFIDWGQIRQSTPTMSFGDGKSTGFHFKNDGKSTAIDVRLENFRVGELTFQGARIIPLINAQNPDFIPAYGLRPKAYDTEFFRRPDLAKYLNEIFASQTADPLDDRAYCSLKVSVVYKDYNNLWYRTRADMRFIGATREIIFLSNTQIKLGEYEPPELLPFIEPT